MKKQLAVLLSLFMVLSLFLVACEEQQPAEDSAEAPPAAAPAEEPADAAPAEASMSEWDGEWNNMGAYLDDEELQEGFVTLAERENVTPEEAKAAYVEKRHCEFDGLIIEGDKVRFLNAFPAAENAEELSAVEYEFVESHTVQHGNFELQWFVFKAKEADAKYPVLLMMEVHGEESMTHFHMRYGDDVDELMAKEGWYPTFVKPNTTTQQLLEEITE
ncbi:MAG: ZinT/AdcA family metal-binding protein [Eubacteriales bacterium]|nr:ZinT/AdcA family metal-binding protein [Eubacteriales bacterium]